MALTVLVMLTVMVILVMDTDPYGYHGVHHYGKRSAEPTAAAEPGYGYYGHGYGHAYGYGHPYAYGHYGHHYGKRSAEAEPHYGYGYAPYAHHGYYGYGHRYGYGYPYGK